MSITFPHVAMLLCNILYILIIHYYTYTCMHVYLLKHQSDWSGKTFRISPAPLSQAVDFILFYNLRRTAQRRKPNLYSIIYLLVSFIKNLKNTVFSNIWTRRKHDNEREGKKSKLLPCVCRTHTRHETGGIEWYVKEKKLQMDSSLPENKFLRNTLQSGHNGAEWASSNRDIGQHWLLKEWTEE